MQIEDDYNNGVLISTELEIQYSSALVSSAL